MRICKPERGSRKSGTTDLTNRLGSVSGRRDTWNREIVREGPITAMLPLLIPKCRAQGCCNIFDGLLPLVYHTPHTEETMYHSMIAFDRYLIA
jgi:hypothetical protein